MVKGSRAETALSIPMIAVFTLCIVWVGVACFRATKPGSRRSEYVNNMRNVGIAIRNYCVQHEGYFPPAFTTDKNDNRLHSWRSLVLPYLDQIDLYREIDWDKPWKDPANEYAYQTIVPDYGCPDSPDEASQTRFLALTTAGSLSSKPTGVHEDEITDDASQTVMLMEVPEKYSVHWMEPSDIDEQLLEQMLDDYDRSFFYVIYADGHSGTLPTEIELKTLKQLITYNDEKIDPDQH